MSFLADEYAVYVLAAYGSTVAILAWLVIATLRANARARAELDEAERRRKR